MKTKLEKNIKEQIERRKVEVSENAWDKLTQMMDGKPSTEKGGSESSFAKRKLWIPVSIAASILLVCTIYLLNSNENIESVHPTNQNKEIVTNQTTADELKEHTTHETPKTVEIVETKKEVFVPQESYLNAEKINSKEILVKSKERKVQPKPEESSPILEQKVDHLVENSKINEQKMDVAMQADPEVESIEKTKYVDPEMLLYSIENNQAVKENNSDSRMVIIDFNK